MAAINVNVKKTINVNVKKTREFHLTVLGRTLEHLGVQMYKRRDVAIAELVANCWDAGAHNVWISAPERSEYSMERSNIEITDDGVGMNADQVEHEYLVVGRNRREPETVIEDQSTGTSPNFQSQDAPVSAKVEKDAAVAEISALPVVELRPVMGRKGALLESDESDYRSELMDNNHELLAIDPT